MVPTAINCTNFRIIFSKKFLFWGARADSCQVSAISERAFSYQLSAISRQRSAISFQGRDKRGKHPLDLNHLAC